MKQPIDEFLEKQKYSLYTQQAAEKMLEIAVNALQDLTCRNCGYLEDTLEALEKINAIASEDLE